MKTLIFFNNISRIGKTTLVYNFSYMLSELGYKTLAVDLDPQSNLTSMFLSGEELFDLYSNENRSNSIAFGIKPYEKGSGDIAPVPVYNINENLALLPGDIDLSLFEDKLSFAWNNCAAGDAEALKIITSIYRIINAAATKINADFTIIDAGPNFGAINRSALISADYVVIPVTTGIFSLHGLESLGNRINVWKSKWQEIIDNNNDKGLLLPNAKIEPLGYIILQNGVRNSSPVKTFKSWSDQIPEIYYRSVLNKVKPKSKNLHNDYYCLSLLKHYYSLTQMSAEAKKPVFLLKPADGVIGAHSQAVLNAQRDFKDLVQNVLVRTGITKS
ncbi:MAG: AAA family ATPase [Ignavibacteriaceae bacterium]|nr:AAA family ATPase [Ignavibacteriaceae bacterium]